MSKKKKSPKDNQSVKKMNKKELRHKILGIFANNPQKTYNYKQIAAILKIKDAHSKQLLIQILEEQNQQKNLEEVRKGRYQLKSRTGYITGKVDMAHAGFAYVVTDQVEDDIFIAQRNLNHALDGDMVKVYIYAKKKGGQIEGEVVEIIKRARNSFVGTLEISKQFAFLVPDSKKMPFDIFVPLESLNGAKDGQKAIVVIQDWPQRAKNPFGKVTEILGYPGEHETEMHDILAEFELPLHFPKKVEEAAHETEEKISKEEINKRRNFRKTTTFTIDPADAKDFDDALSYENLPNGNIEVGIHIADVTHYVKPDTLLDQEGYNRATSIYLVDRVVPMLPEQLSNKVCSLRPDEDKLTFSAVFEMDSSGKIHNEWFGKTIIRSNRRFTYEQAQEVIDEKSNELGEEIRTLHAIGQKLRKERLGQGGIDMDRIEVEFEIGKSGEPLNILLKEHTKANQLIEEFMLLANRRVAAQFKAPKGQKNKTAKKFVYRIHDFPDGEKLEKFNYFVQKYGYKLDFTNKQTLSNSLNNVLNQAKGEKEQDLIETLILRSMAKAKYSTKNIGHYGLSFEHYTHFTSPIRRYPDMMVHRLLEMHLNGEDTNKVKNLEQQCEHCSDMERLSIEAERASIKYKQVEYMSDRIGEEYDGIISGVTSKGLYVEMIENKCEGMIPVSELDDDFYEYDEDHFCLIGRKKKKIFQLGDNLKVKVTRTNIIKRFIDLEPIN